MGLITKVRSRVKSSKALSKQQQHKLTYQQEQLFGLHLSQSGLLMSEFGKTPSPHGVYYNLLGCPRSKKSYYNYECNFQKNPETIVMLLLLPLLLGRIGLFYACILYQYPLHTIFDWTKKWLLTGCSHVRNMGSRLYRSLDKCEISFVNMNLYNMVNQIVFFMVCDRAVGLRDKERVTSLYSLLFYNVLAYCFSYVKEVIEKETFLNLNVNVTPSSQVRHLAMTTTKIVLEWIKAVTFIITVVCMLLVLGLEQGLEYYSPTRCYLAVTILYFVLTEKLIQNAFPNLLTYIPYQRFQDEICGLEKTTSVLLIKSLTASLNIFLLLVPLLNSSPRELLPFSLTSIKITMVTLYFNVWLQYKSSLLIKSQLEEEVSLVSEFRMASKQELESHDDVCAICLTPLDYARVTPCQHLFHTNCLRLCLKASSNLCPICKREFNFTRVSQ